MVVFSSTVRQPASFSRFQLGANCERLGRAWDHGRRLIEPNFRSWRLSFHVVARPIRGGTGTASLPIFNCGAVAANHAHTR